jgi:hypothetical protein
MLEIIRRVRFSRKLPPVLRQLIPIKGWYSWEVQIGPWVIQRDIETGEWTTWSVNRDQIEPTSQTITGDKKRSTKKSERIEGYAS